VTLYEELQSRVIKSGMCTICGVCISACPNNFIHFIDQNLRWPATKSECEYCDKCYNACYVIRREFLPEIARVIFGIRKRESMGAYKRIVSARTKQEDTKQVCQDGGIATSLLIHALSENLIDGALVVGRDGWMPIASIAKSKDEIISSAMTKYGTTPVLKELRPAVIVHGLSRICIVGSPCHVQSLRYCQYSNMLLMSAVKLIIGLFCRENYKYQCIEDKLREKGLKIGETQKFEISEEFNIWVEGKKIFLPIVEVKNWVPKHCLVCEDFVNELADISIGREGSSEGWSTVIIRTEEGEALFSRLEENKIIEVKPVENLDRIREMADRKREQAKLTRKIFRLKEQALGKHEIVAKLGISDEVWAKLRLSEEWLLYRLEGFS
jgi:coenzyme F420 hydrogenase subunit beta